MIGFNFYRLFTSHARWLVGLLSGLIRREWLALSPPILSIQWLFSLRDRKLISVSIGSYFDWATIHEVFVRREYSTDEFVVHPGVWSHYEKIATNGIPLILDLGANVGISARFFSSAYKDATIIAIEPSSQNFKLLTQNCLGQKNIRPTQGAIGSASGTVSLFDPGNGNNAFRTFGDVSKLIEVIPLYSIGSILEREPGLTPFIVKIDIEGAERELFSSNTDWVDLFKVIVVETHDWMLPGEAASSTLLSALGGKRRDLLVRGENIFSIRVD